MAGGASYAVSDNGHGIPAAEAPLAFERHATSKLLTVEDLEHIGTFGFRGEALYSIAAVSQLTLTTRARAEEFATTLRLDGGVIQSQGRAGAPVGTVVNVENLFFNVPARQKFLRAGAGEAGQIADVVQHYALAHPERRFSFVSEGKLLFQSNGTGDLFDVLVKIYGLENARQMVPLGTSALLSRETPPEPDDLPPEIDFMADVTAVDTATRNTQPSGLSPQGRSHATLSVSGHASLPSLTRPNRSAIDLFVNRRYVEDRTLTHAVVQAYYTLLPGGRYPVAVVFVDIDPAEVDVNVHPQKLQVRFAAERKVFSEVQKAVRRAIVGAAPVPDLAVDEEGRLAPAPAAPDTRPETSAWSARRDLIVNAGQQQHTFEMYVPGNAERGMRNAERGSGKAKQQSHECTSHPTRLTRNTHHAPRITHSHSSPLAPRPSALPPLRVVGQIGAMYIVAEGPDGVFLIDQHAAHERVLYEKFLGQRYGTADGAVAQQHLLEPHHFARRGRGWRAWWPTTWQPCSMWALPWRLLAATHSWCAPCPACWQAKTRSARWKRSCPPSTTAATWSARSWRSAWSRWSASAPPSRPANCSAIWKCRSWCASWKHASPRAPAPTVALP